MPKPARKPFPILLPTLSGYRPAWLGRDILAGLSAGAVVIPQAMAYATIANLPVQVGLYTCIVPMLVYAFLGGSRAMSVSTTSTIATLTASTLVSVGITANSEDALGSLVALTLLVGLFLGLLRLLRWGSLIENISSATILGVQVGVGATVAAGQIPKLLGVDTNYSGHGFIRSLVAILESVPQAHPPTVALSAAVILVLILLQRFAPGAPAPLIVVVLSILLVGVANIDDRGITLISPIPQGLPFPQLPDLSALGSLVPGALGIGTMAFLESIAVARSIRSSAEPQADTERELFALAAANTAGAFFSVLPAAGGFSQSAVNRSAGARSQLSALTTVALAILTALFVGPILSLLPEAALAALVFVAVGGLVKVGQLVRLARISPVDFWVASATAAIGLTAGLLAAVGIGVVLTLLLVLRELNTPRLEILGRQGQALAVGIGHGLYTANVLTVGRALIALVKAEQQPVTALIIDVRQLNAISLTVLDALADLDRELSAGGVTLHLARLPETAEKIAQRTSWFSELAALGRVHQTVRDGLQAATS